MLCAAAAERAWMGGGGGPPQRQAAEEGRALTQGEALGAGQVGEGDSVRHPEPREALSYEAGLQRGGGGRGRLAALAGFSAREGAAHRHEAVVVVILQVGRPLAQVAAAVRRHPRAHAGADVADDGSVR